MRSFVCVLVVALAGCTRVEPLPGPIHSVPGMVGTVPLRDVVDAIAADYDGRFDALWVTGLPEPYRESHVECEWRQGSVRYRFQPSGLRADPDAPWHRDWQHTPGDEREYPFPISPDMDDSDYGAFFPGSRQAMRFVDAGDSPREMWRAWRVAFLCSDGKHAAFLDRDGASGGTFILTRDGDHWGSIRWVDEWVE